jgi:hypothetical protein
MLPFALRQYCLSDSSLTPDEVCMAGADKARLDEHIDWKIGKMKEHLQCPHVEINDNSR